MTRFRLLASRLIIAGALGGCASGMHMGYGSDTAHTQEPQMDMQAMCAMHKQMMAGKTAAEQQALVDEHMKSMTPQMQQRMRSMMAGCS